MSVKVKCRTKFISLRAPIFKPSLTNSSDVKKPSLQKKTRFHSSVISKQALSWAGVLWIIASLLALFLLWMLIPQERLDWLFQREDQTWQAMQTRGTWRVGLDPSFPPFESLDENGKPVGYDIDLAQQMAQIWGLQLEVVTIGYDSLLDALQAGKIDSVVSALPYDPRLTKDYKFSKSYFEAGLRLAVRSETQWIIPAIWDDQTIAELLSNRAIVVEWGSMGDMVGRRLQRLEPNLQIIPLETPQEAIEALSTGHSPIGESVDALLVDNVTLRQAQGNSSSNGGNSDNSGSHIQAIGPAIESNPYVIAMPLRADMLHTQVEKTIQQLQEIGTLQAIEVQWFGAK